MPYAAFDLHKREFEVAVFDDSGQITHRQRFAGTAEAILTFAKRYLSPLHKVVMEATFNTWAVVELLEPLVGPITVSNPMQTRAIAQAKVKTDKIDVNVLGHLLRLDYLPTVWQPDRATRQLRAQTTERASLTQDRTRLKNRIHGVLNQRLIAIPKPIADVFAAAGLHWLRELDLDAVGRRALDRMLAQLELVELQIEATHKPLAEAAYADRDAMLLMTLPGVGMATALALRAALGDYTRFDSPDQMASYIGLVPATYQSGDSTHHGHITKHGNSHARWMLTEAAQAVDTHPGPLGHFFRKLARKKNRNVAVVATARKLVTIAWHMLRHQEPYRYALPDPTRKKLLTVRVLATGERRKSGVSKGQKAVAKLTPGTGSRQVKSLPQLYAEESLPPLMTTLNPGETRMLQDHGAAGFAASVLVPRRVVRRTAGQRESNSSPR
jgi:transposase